MRESKWVVFAIGFCITLTSCFYLSDLTECSNPDRALGDLAISSGDTFSYTGAMENYIQTGEYFFFNGERKVFAGRMPHYSAPYWLFRQVFDTKKAYDLVVLFQVLVSSFAVVCAFSILKQLGCSLFVSYLGAFLLALSPNFSHYAFYISPESLSSSFLIIFIWVYFIYLNRRKKEHLILCGVFLAFLVSLKAYFILLFIPVGIQFLNVFFSRKKRKQALIEVVKLTLIVSLPLMILLSPWIMRNYVGLGKFIPLQETTTAGYNYSDADFAFRRFLMAWGGDIINWEKTSAGCFFIPTAGIECEYTFPEYAFSRSYNIDDVKKVRDKYVLLQQNFDETLERKVVEDFNRLTELYKQDRPLWYYIISPLILVKKFLVHSGSSYLPIHTSNPCFFKLQYVIKAFTSGMYWLTLVFGSLGFLYLIKRKAKFWILGFVPICLIVLFPIALRSVEWRMFEPTFSVLLILSMFFSEFFFRNTLISSLCKIHQERNNKL